MRAYGVRDVEKLLGLPRSTIRALINAGFVSPARGPRNAWQFSFQDLIVLRTAQALSAAKLSHRRITKSLKELRQHLPAAMPLSGLRIGAVGDRVVVKEGGQQWHVDSGQYLLAFEGNPVEGSLSIFARVPGKGEAAGGAKVAPASPTRHREEVLADTTSPGATKADVAAEKSSPHKDGEDSRSEKPSSSESASSAGADSVPISGNRRPQGVAKSPDSATEWFERAVDLERDDVDAAVHAYERAIAANPQHLDAHVNFGRLLHESGRLAQAERIYRAALRNCGDDALVLFNLGVLLEDMSRARDAATAYEAALRIEPTLADGHYNLALLYEQLQKPKDAIRHMAQYRRLVGSKD